MSVEDWEKLGYSHEQSEELERLSHIGDDMGDIDVHVADKMLQETMRKYKTEKENKIMNNTTNLVNDFVIALKERADNFNNWVTMNTAFLNAKDSFNKNTNAIKELDVSLNILNKNEIKSVNTIEIDLVKEGIDVSKWEDSVKPAKLIISVMIKYNSDNVSIEIGNMIMLMKDGTFRMD